MKLALALALLLTLATPILAQTEDLPARVVFGPEAEVEPALVRVLEGAKGQVILTTRRMDTNTRYGAQDFDEFPTILDTLRALRLRGVRVRVVLQAAPQQAETVRRLLAAKIEVYSAPAVGLTMISVDGQASVIGAADLTQTSFARRYAAWVFQPRRSDHAAFLLDVVAKAHQLRRENDRAQGSLAHVNKRFGFNWGTDQAALEFMAKAIGEARQRVLLAGSGLPEPLRGPLTEAAKRGVELRLLLDQTAKVDGLPTRSWTSGLIPVAERARPLDHGFLVVDENRVFVASLVGRAQAQRLSAELIPTFSTEHARLWEQGRDLQALFLRRLSAPEDSRDYRRFVPCQFPPMALTTREQAELLAAARRAGFVESAGRHWYFDRETGRGTDAVPMDHPPFFGLRQMVISEVCHRPARRRSGQYVELTNGSAEPVDLSGWLLSDGDSRDRLVPWRDSPTVVPPGGKALLLDPDFDDDRPLPKDVALLTTSDRSLGNGLAPGDVLTLFDPQGVALDRCPLDRDVPEGQVLRRLRVAQRSYPGNWEVAKPRSER